MELLVSGLCRKTLFVVSYSMNHDPIWNYFGFRPMSHSYAEVLRSHMELLVSGLCRKTLFVVSYSMNHDPVKLYSL